MGARPASRDGFEMLARAVSLVPREPVLGKLAVQFVHDAVPRDFRNDARGGDRLGTAIPFDDAALGDRAAGDLEPVDQKVVGQGCDLVHGAVHGRVIRRLDAHPVDFAGRNHGNPDGVGTVTQHVKQMRPFFGRQLLGIVQAGQGVADMKRSISSRIQADSVSFQRRSRLGMTPSKVFVVL